MVEIVIGCKWSLTVLDLVVRGIRRPGEMERSVDGLTAKVLNDCLRRLVEFHVLEKRSYPELPPRVEYAFTEFGEKFVKLLDALDALETDFESTGQTASPTNGSDCCSKASGPSSALPVAITRGARTNNQSSRRSRAVAAASAWPATLGEVIAL
jgi:DNA-binding HxlR family transcriptional regulator